MLLKELLKDIKREFMIDEQLKAYLYENKIELVDFTSGFEYEVKEEKKVEDDFYGNIGTLYLENGKITHIENNSIHLITKSNQQLVIYLASLIGTIIDDYNSYDKLKNIRQLDCITL